MSDDCDPNAATNFQRTHREGQFHLRTIFTLTAAVAAWFFWLADFRHEPLAIVVLWTITILAGVCGHLMYTHLFPLRGTVVTSLIVLPAMILTAAFTMLGLDDATYLLISPIDLFAHQSWPHRVRSTIPVFACIAILTAAHPIKPSLINAIITAIGISLWYGLAILIVESAG